MGTDPIFLIRLALLAASAAAIWLVFDLGGLDRRLVALAYDPALGRFPLRHEWLLEKLGHDGLKWTMVGFWAACLAWRPLRRGAVYMAAAALAVTLLKHASGRSCPWDLAEYGSRLLEAPGGCSPAAHPVVGFALFGLYLSLKDSRVLAAAWILGLAAGAVQVARGAHFPSHVLWTAWVSWAAVLSADALWRRS